MTATISVKDDLRNRVNNAMADVFHRIKQCALQTGSPLLASMVNRNIYTVDFTAGPDMPPFTGAVHGEIIDFDRAARSQIVRDIDKVICVINEPAQYDPRLAELVQVYFNLERVNESPFSYLVIQKHLGQARALLNEFPITANSINF